MKIGLPIAEGLGTADTLCYPSQQAVEDAAKQISCPAVGGIVTHPTPYQSAEDGCWAYQCPTSAPQQSFYQSLANTVGYGYMLLTGPMGPGKIMLLAGEAILVLVLVSSRSKKGSSSK